MVRFRLLVLFLLLLLTACSRPWTEKREITPASIWASGSPGGEAAKTTPTRSYQLPPVRSPDALIFTPTPDSPHYQPGERRGEETYQVQPGDMLSAIAGKYMISLEALVQANEIVNPDSLEVGQVLIIPSITPQSTGPAIKIIPDSEMVYGPLSESLNISATIDQMGGYLKDYSQDVNGRRMNGAQIVETIARNYSVNPRLLLALLEYRSGWLTNPELPDPALAEMPFGFSDDWYMGLYRQLAWVAINLNSGFYRWLENQASDWVLRDGSVVPVAPTINAGTAGIQQVFAALDDYPTWLQDVSADGFSATYEELFGSPFDFAIEPLLPVDLTQPAMNLPFNKEETWSFTGAPHLAWDAGTPFGALDFAPPGEALGCVESNNWVTAVAGGLVTRTGEGVVVLDLDGDGNEGSGWVVVYMHIEQRSRIPAGTRLAADDQLGHPSCEGGLSSGTHVHLARKFNGVWIKAVGKVPFIMDNWVPTVTGGEYEGILTRGADVVEAYESNSEINKIQR